MKLKSEYNILELANSKFSPTILRMGTLYCASPRMRFDLVVNLFTIKALKEQGFQVFGGNQRRTFCHVKDAAKAYINCIESPIEDIHNKIFNVSSENYMITELGKLITKIIPDSKMTLNDKKYDNRDYISSSEKIRTELGFESKYTIEDGIYEIIESSGKWSNYGDIIYDNYKLLKEEGLRSYYG